MYCIYCVYCVYCVYYMYCVYCVFCMYCVYCVFCMYCVYIYVHSMYSAHSTDSTQVQEYIHCHCTQPTLLSSRSDHTLSLIFMSGSLAQLKDLRGFEDFGMLFFGKFIIGGGPALGMPGGGGAPGKPKCVKNQ